MRRLAALLTLLLLAAACRGPAGPTAAPTPTPEAFSMGGEALGGTAETSLLARQALDQLPEGELAWITHSTRLEPGQTLEHSHEFAFAYAAEGAHRLDAEQLEEGEGAAVPAGQTHRHQAADSPSTVWEIRLAASGSPYPGLESTELLFESAPLQGIPPRPLAVFVHVRVPSGGQTSVHTHPGPELIYQIQGRIEYQNALIGTIEMGAGAGHGIPPHTPVQKRNPFPEPAEFLSWFLVDPALPFATAARFALEEPPGENVAPQATLVGTSSDFSSAYRGAHALDGNPATEWSSAGDGDGAWIEIRLPRRIPITAIAVHTRTMGRSAQVHAFRVVTGEGTVLGPFELPDATRPYVFEVQLEAERLRFEVVSSSGGNTGFVDLFVYTPSG